MNRLPPCAKAPEDFTAFNINPDDARDLVCRYCDLCDIRSECLRLGLAKNAAPGVYGGLVVVGPGKALLPDQYARQWTRRVGRPRKESAA